MILEFRFWILDWGRERTQRYLFRGLMFNACANRHSGRAEVIPAFTGMMLMALVANPILVVVDAADTPKWQAEWQKTIDGAKKEGQLSLYGGQEITHPDITSAFSKEFPFIKIISASGRAADMAGIEKK